MGKTWDKIMKCATGLILLGLCVLLINIRVKAEENVIKVGFYEMAGFQYTDEHGNKAGYNIEYLSTLSKRGEWSYEFIEFEDFSAALDALRNKEIDLLAPCKMSNERILEFSYSDYSFGTDYYVLVTMKNNEKYGFEGYDDYNGMTVAVIDNYPLTDDFIAHMKDKGFEAELVYYESENDVLEALNKGETDAAITSLMVVGDEYKVLLKYAASPFYFMTWQGNEGVLVQLNNVMQHVNMIYPNLLRELEEKYYPMYSQQFFTVEEMKFIEETDTLRVAYVEGYSPVSFTDENGQLAGISRRVFDKIQEVTGLKFEYVKLKSGDITYNFLVENDINLVTGVTYNSININANGMVLSTPYFVSSKVLVGKDIEDFDKDESKTVAILRGSQTIEKVFKTVYPNFEVVNYDTVEKCFDAVRKGKADYVLVNQYVANNMLLKPKYYQMEIIPIEGLPDELCFSTITALDGTGELSESDCINLIMIIDKAIAMIGVDKLNEYVVEETMRYKHTDSMADVLYKYRALVAATILLVILAALIVIIVCRQVIEKRKFYRKAKERERLQQKRYEAIVNNSDAMIYEVSTKGMLIASEQITEKFGWTIPENVDKINAAKLVEILHVHPDDGYKFIETAIVDREDVVEQNNILVRIGNINDEYIWCELTRIPIYSKDNKLVSVVGKIVDVDARVREREILERKARTDGLSGLLNKRTFKEDVEEYLKEQSSYYSAMIFVDMDRFKDINDRFGHHMGDNAIKDTSEKLGLIFSHIDFISRFGGDEFCIFVKNIPESTLVDKVQWALEKLKETYENERGKVYITASIGVAYAKRNDVTYEEFIKAADEAVYEVKHQGRNGYIVRML